MQITADIKSTLAAVILEVHTEIQGLTARMDGLSKAACKRDAAINELQQNRIQLATQLMAV